MRHYRKFNRLLLVTLSGVLLAAAWGQWSYADPVAELMALADSIQNQAPGIGFQVWTEGEKTSYQLADTVVFGFTADRDCYLAMLNIGTSGRTTILFPNKWHPNNKIDGGKTYRIPPEGSDYAFKLMGPAGTERIKVIASIEPVLGNVQSLQQELSAPLEQSPGGGTFLTIKNPGLVLKDIGFALGGTEPSKWAAADLSFNVFDGTSAPQMGGPPPGQQQSPGIAPQAPQQ